MLGFDARERWCPASRLFPPERAARFLLREDVDKVLSADVMVWPTVFADSDVGHLALEDLSLGAGGVPRPGWVGGLQGLWRSLAELDAALDAAPSLPGPCDVVAFAARSHPRPDLGPADPPSPGAAWRILGYDVVDAWLLSGLSNCGFEPAELPDLRRRWRPHLNRAHLFEAVESADRFRRECDARVPEHAPFMVCGLLVRS